jgi:bloom syndrome protein
MLRMIESDRDMTKEQKDRQKAALHEVLRYCENKTDCRRSQVLSFFSETFDAKNCHGGCDVCLHKNKNVYTSEDVTADAIKMIKMVQAFDRDDRITGSSRKGLSSNEYFGSGKSWNPGEAERLVAALVINCGLDEFNVQNGAGYSNSYLKVCRRIHRAEEL